MAAERSAGIPRRLLQLWGLYARMDLLWVTRGLKLFLLWTLADSVMNIASVTSMWLLAERFNGIGHWSRTQVLFMLGYGVTATGLVDTFFGYNISYISRRLGRGQLDHVLIQPQPIWLSLLTEGFIPISGSAILLPGLTLLGWSAHRLGLPHGPGWLVLLGLDLIASVVILLAFQFLWGSLAFWAPRSAEEISSSSMQLMTQLLRYPLDGLSIWLTGGLLTILPAGFLAWYPCRTLLGIPGGAPGIWVTPLAAAGFSIAAAAAWRKGIKHYGRVGSQRYHGRGHRS